MNKIRKLISLNKLLEYMENEIDDVNNNFGIYSIDSQIWKDENDPRYEYLGYAMQCIDPPCPVPFNLERYEIDDDKIKLQILITEFLELLYKELKKGSFFPEENRFFRTHYNNSTIILSIASDKIRKLLIIGVLNEVSKNYYRKPYHYPFEESVDFLRNFHSECKFKNVKDELANKFLDEIQFLPRDARKISEFKKERNKIVHNLFTKEAESEGKMLKKHKLSSSSFRKNRNYNRTHMENQLAESRKTMIENIESSMNKLKNWYSLLVKLGNLVFQAEYMVRK